MGDGLELGGRCGLRRHDGYGGAVFQAVRCGVLAALSRCGQSATNWNDARADYRANEIAINWQGALVYALAGFVSGEAK